ncbi:Aste57867_15855 [Aphanomyces stellatus]|uniref:Aste57867_15855 protein n=1 Tax=Aphanomyces stellatus TaxID=120398 RepID=A0A485L719_9STRA|nr:hypothetical protein As57867_015799 [Aphanomyces stellatus]VFT92642.1 Aste57867_15855 [Aphanomyces stellatus]
MALASTRNHADCVIKSFFNYLNGCARSRVLPVKDLKCLDKALNNGKCEWAKEVADGWNLPSFLKKYGSLAFNKALVYIKQRWGTTQEAQLGKVINDLITAVAIDTTQTVEFISSDYDFTHRRTSVNVCTLPAPWHLLSDKGSDADSLQYHLPVTASVTVGKTEYAAEPKTQWSGKNSIYGQCDAYYQQTKKNYKDATVWQCPKFGQTYLAVRINTAYSVECLTDDAWKFGQCTPYKTSEACDAAIKKIDDKVQTFQCDDALVKKGKNAYGILKSFCGKAKRLLGNDQDKCYSYNSHSIKFLETGETQVIKVDDIVWSDGETKWINPFCKKASWVEPNSCNSHLTQWTQSVSCCKSYETVLREVQDAWDRQNNRYGNNWYGNNNNGGYNNGYNGPRGLEEELSPPIIKSEPEPVYGRNTRPTKVPDNYDTKACPYEKILTSTADDWETGEFHGALYSADHSPVWSTDDIGNIDHAIATYLGSWFDKCAKAYDDGDRVTEWCTTVGEWLIEHKPSLLGNSNFAQILKWIDDHGLLTSIVAADYENAEIVARDDTDVDYYKQPSGLCDASYIAGSSSYKRLCNSLKRSWDLDTVVPIVSTKCFPQSCVLAQLAKCVDIPEKETGYDYVAQPAPGYNGYRPSGYQRSLMALETVHVGVLAVSGFVAGAAVIVVAQVLTKLRRGGAVSSPTYQLV